VCRRLFTEVLGKQLIHRRNVGSELSLELSMTLRLRAP
jgi:hypothetical protein